MDFSFLLEHHRLNLQALTQDGFALTEGTYQKKRAFADLNFYGIIRLNQDIFDIKVYETSFDEEYIPFTLKSVQSPLVAGLKEQVNAWVNELLAKDFDQNDLRKKTIAYCEEKYGSKEEHPFDEDPYAASSVLRVGPQGKWYALFMGVPAKSMGFPSSEEIQIVNLKEKPEDMERIIDHIHVFPAYHMNKKYWITVLLDETLDFSHLSDLIEESYQLVKGTKKTKNSCKKPSD
jgi:Uncharacterized protein conserved in bacteria